MTNSESPSTYWTHQHGHKQSYADPFSAERAAIRLTEDCAGTSRYDEAVTWNAYPCCWGGDYRDGRTAQEHWHIGRPGRRHR